jgi:UDP-glucose 4-epimerase
MRLAITGGAGFVGSNLVDAALAAGHSVTVIDNFSTGTPRFLEHLAGDPRVTVHELDVAADADRLPSALDGVDAVFHLAANADVRYGWDNPRRDLEQNVVATHNVAEAMRAVGARRLLFSSTGSVYGTTDVIPTPEDCPFPVQTSLYGASKAAAEGFLAAYAEAGLLDVTVFRFVSIMGERYTHGHVVDFLRKLRADPARLEILGDGEQRKSYLAVRDCVAAMLHVLPPAEPFSVYNLGVDSYCTVVESARVRGRRPRVDRRQPVHLAGHGEDPLDGVGAHDDHQGGRRVDGRLPRRQRLDPRPGRATGVTGTAP